MLASKIEACQAKAVGYRCIFYFKLINSENGAAVASERGGDNVSKYEIKICQKSSK
jgi:hypothetical protein